jgi:RNA polymerase sigma factor (sigma-70 family)
VSNRSIIFGWQMRWNKSLFRFLGKRVRTPVDVEDLAQEIYLRLLRARDLDQVRNPQAYLLTIARHVLAEWHEHRQHEDPLSLLDEAELGQDQLQSGMEADLSQMQLDAALTQFSPLTRAILLLRFRDEYSYKEIADRLSLSERQVRRHLTRGYEQLREILLVERSQLR